MLVLNTTRDISKDEEIFWDYGKLFANDYFYEWCWCVACGPQTKKLALDFELRKLLNL